jgi:hypothetical protein
MQIAFQANIVIQKILSFKKWYLQTFLEKKDIINEECFCLLQEQPLLKPVLLSLCLLIAKKFFLYLNLSILANQL